ncbi:hypothetical protein ETAA8_37200 [Anatilimnocola aggregata]|uniref:Uncharacterized protein n=1 Tax=Anatilimnocola aggregata TaxID=2528021 RepID=A0A517YEH9_9BACT|nr:hypothetical protein [Anatilimnocola aggregata]QDU28617.1 hypothetical protein ETAA8_37200 [Anatilimnocola aggregata]
MFFFKRSPQPLVKRRWRWSWRSSFWLHSLLVSAVITELVMVVAPLPVAPPVQQVVLHAPPIDEPPLPHAVTIEAFTPNTEHWLADEAVSTRDIEAAQGDPRFAWLSEGDFDARTPAEQAAASDFLSARVMSTIAEAEKHSAADNLQRLENLTGQLNDVATEQSVHEVTTQLSKLLGTSPRANEPAKKPVAGEFDLDSAQLHDVRREMLDDGSFKYIAILIDSAGRSTDTELSAEEGESAFKTFELIKSNPLLERVYRGVVMSLLDKMMKPSTNK